MGLDVCIPRPASSDSEEAATWLEKARLWKCFVTAKNRAAASRNGTFVEHQIAAWVTKQRREFKLGVLSPEKIQILSEADFEWSIDFESRWEECFASLQVYIHERGSWPRLRGDSSHEIRLAGWVAGQRAAIRGGRIGLGRLEKLRGFSAWTAREEQGSRWDCCFQRWISFVKNQNRAPLYDAVDPEERSLYRWIDRQRTQHREGRLASERVDRLNLAGFLWAAY